MTVGISATLTSVVSSLYPNVLPAIDPARSLTVFNASSPEAGLRVALAWFLPGALLVGVYFSYLYRKVPGKVAEA